MPKKLPDHQIKIKYSILNLTCSLEYQKINKIDYLNPILRMAKLA